MPQLIESFQEWSARHGGAVRNPDLADGVGGGLPRFVCSDGAASDGERHWEPPEGEFNRLEAQRLYYAALLRREEEAWESFRSECLQQAALASRYSNLPPPPADAEVRLVAGAQRIAVLRGKLAGVSMRLVEEPTRKAAREAADRKDSAERERQQQLAQRVSRLRAMNLPQLEGTSDE